DQSGPRCGRRGRLGTQIGHRDRQPAPGQQAFGLARCFPVEQHRSAAGEFGGLATADTQQAGHRLVDTFAGQAIGYRQAALIGHQFFSGPSAGEGVLTPSAGEGVFSPSAGGCAPWVSAGEGVLPPSAGVPALVASGRALLPTTPTPRKLSTAMPAADSTIATSAILPTNQPL